MLLLFAGVFVCLAHKKDVHVNSPLTIVSALVQKKEILRDASLVVGSARRKERREPRPWWWLALLVRGGLGVASISSFRRARYADFSAANPRSGPFCGRTRALAWKTFPDRAQRSRYFRREPTAMC